MRYVTIRELDRLMLADRRITVTYRNASEVVECQVNGCDQIVPPALFTIYLDNGLISKIDENQFGISPLGRARIARR